MEEDERQKDKDCKMKTGGPQEARRQLGLQMIMSASSGGRHSGSVRSIITSHLQRLGSSPIRAYEVCVFPMCCASFLWVSQYKDTHLR